MSPLVLPLLLLISTTDLQEAQRVTRETQTISTELMSPFCKGLTLASCSSGRAAEWRREIKGWVQEGVPREQIEARLQERVPSFRLSSKPPGAWDWLLPIFALLAAVGMVALVSRRLVPRGPKNQSIQPLSPPSEPSSAAKSRLNAELSDLEG